MADKQRSMIESDLRSRLSVLSGTKEPSSGEDEIPFLISCTLSRFYNALQYEC